MGMLIYFNEKTSIHVDFPLLYNIYSTVFFFGAFPPDSCCPFVLRVLMILLTSFDESVLQPPPQQANIAKENGLFADDLPSMLELCSW